MLVKILNTISEVCSERGVKQAPPGCDSPGAVEVVSVPQLMASVQHPPCPSLGRWVVGAFRVLVAFAAFVANFISILISKLLLSAFAKGDCFVAVAVLVEQWRATS